MEKDEFQSHVTDSLARLETLVESLTGNGQPGRVGKLELQVDELRQAKWMVVGAATTLSTLGGAIMHFLFKK